MNPARYSVILFVALACERSSPQLRSDSILANNAPPLSVEEHPWYASWIIGEGWEMEDTIPTSRFQVEVMKLGSLLTVRLDTAPVGTAGRSANFTPADSVRVTGLSKLDTFAQMCRAKTGTQSPVIALMSDTVRGRRAQPKMAWLLDTTMVRISQILTEGVSCVVPTPD